MPIGTPGNLYFLECSTEKKIKIKFEGEIPYGNLSIFKQDNCQVVNMELLINLRLVNPFTCNVSGLGSNKLDMSNVKVDFNLSLDSDNIKMIMNSIKPYEQELQNCK